MGVTLHGVVVHGNQTMWPFVGDRIGLPNSSREFVGGRGVLVRISILSRWSRISVPLLFRAMS